MRRTIPIDITLFLAVLALVGFGLTFIYSASYPKAMASAETNYNSFSFAFRQIIFALIGYAAMAGCIYTPLTFFRRYSMWIIGGTIALLLIVLVFAADKHGNRSYMNIGPIQFQPSEFAKIAIVLTLSAFLAQRPWMVKTFDEIRKGPLLYVAVPALLVLLEKDLGMTIAITIATTVILLVAGMKFRYVGIPLAVMLLIGGTAFATLHLAGKGHGKVSGMIEKAGLSQKFERIEAWFNPMDESLQASYHPRNSLLAIGSGGFFGRGFNQSRQKWFYLPAAQNDYIASVVAEETGFLGMLVLLLLHGIVIFRGFSIAHRAPDEYSALVATGCTVMLAVNVLINIMVASNMLPSMGLNLPFISYGGSSLIASLMMAGLLLNISAMRPVHETRRRGEMGGEPAPAQA